MSPGKAAIKRTFSKPSRFTSTPLRKPEQATLKASFWEDFQNSPLPIVDMALTGDGRIVGRIPVSVEYETKNQSCDGTNQAEAPETAETLASSLTQIVVIFRVSFA
jgi:hypothetical protein